MPIYMKEICQEYSIVKSPDSKVISLYRFPSAAKIFNPSEVRFKPVSKYTEIKVSLPSKNTSALKMKTLNTDSITYKAFPTSTGSYYYTRVEGDKIALYKVQNSYLFQPSHEYYPFDYQSSKLKKAESREEYEHRMKSINFKLKNVESEEFRALSFEDFTAKPSTSETQGASGNVQPENKANEAHDCRAAPEKLVGLKKIEETVKSTRIVNLKDLLGMFPCESAVKTVLFKMAENVCGRFILKNGYYEKTLHEMRNAMLDCFRKSGEVSAKDLNFLGDERWLADEIADFLDGKYVLKGYPEELDFDTSHVRAANLCLIKDLLACSRMLSASQISQKLSIDKEIVCDLVHHDGEFFHLSNNSYALNDGTYWLNGVFEILCNKKSFELSELENRLLDRGITYQQHELIDEIKKYCSSRGNKYFLKATKE